MRNVLQRICFRQPYRELGYLCGEARYAYAHYAPFDINDFVVEVGEDDVLIRYHFGDVAIWLGHGHPFPMLIYSLSSHPWYAKGL